MSAENKNKNEEWFSFIKSELEKDKQIAIEETIEQIINPNSSNQDDLRKQITSYVSNIFLKAPKIEYNLQDFKNPNLNPEFINILNLINELFWKNFKEVDIRNYPLIGYAEKDKQLKAVVDFYDSVFNKIEVAIDKIDNKNFEKLIKKDIDLKKMSNSQTVYTLLNSSNNYSDFKKEIQKITPKTKLSLEDIISKDPYKQFLPENTFFNLMYDGTFYLKTNLNLKNLTSLNIKNNKKVYFLETFLPDFKEYLINAKNLEEKAANRLIETTREIFLRDDKIVNLKKRLFSLNQALNQKLKEARKLYESKLKEYKTKEIIIKKPQELTSIENYILDLKKKSEDLSQSIYKLDESFKAYLVALNLNYDTLSNNNLEPLKQYFKENDSTFKRYGLFNLGKEMIDKGILKENKDPADTCYEFINEFLNRLKLEDKIKNWNYENFLKEQKKII